MSRLPYWILLITLALAPLPFGANRPWSWSLLSLVIGILLIGWALAALRDPGRVRSAWRHHWIATCLFLLLMVWAAVRAVVPATKCSTKRPCLYLLRRLFRMLPMITTFWRYLGQPLKLTRP